MDPSDFHLARRAANGDQGAFRQILERHYNMIYALAYRYFGNMADAEDVTQEICLRLAESMRGFEGRSKFSTWIYRVTLNACRDHTRHQQGQQKLERTSAEVTYMQTAASQETAHQVTWLYETIGTLEPSLKETVLLVLSQELTHREAAEILGVAENTVSWRMHEVKKRLRALAELADA
jgi:RNA polymerase sigma-70 factor (ECF subfamily)